jgi:resorcinol 4-hydroxylase (FADH2)
LGQRKEFELREDGMALASFESVKGPGPAIPSVASLIERAAGIGAVARDRAREFETQRHVSADLVDRMRDAQLFRIMQPRRFGGFEYGYDVFIEAVSAVASGDGSTGWVYSLGAVHPWMIACYPDEAQHDFWRDSHDEVAAVSYAPADKAIAVDGGYRMSGRWSFASGVDNATWGIIGGLLPGSDGLKPGFFLVPKSDYTVFDDWDPMGLAGTGSKTIVLDDAFIPAHRVVSFQDMLTGNGPGTTANANPLYRQPMLAVVPHCLVSPALGMARGALQVFVDHVGTRTTRGAVAGGNNRMSEFATVQSRVAEATACIDAAQLMMHRDVRETAEIAMNGEAVGIDKRLRNRLTHTFATKLLVQAVDAVFLAMGGNALGLNHPVQRFWRDIHAASSHISLNWDAVSTMYGQHIFGLEPKGQY